MRKYNIEVTTKSRIVFMPSVYFYFFGFRFLTMFTSSGVNKVLKSEILYFSAEVE